jgi:hypothetical protein
MTVKGVKAQKVRPRDPHLWPSLISWRLLDGGELSWPLLVPGGEVERQPLTEGAPPRSNLSRW